MTRAEESPSRLSKHFAATYHSLRLGIAAIGVSLPLVLWMGGVLAAGLSLRPSMSAYYHTGMRDVFVGALCAIGVGLYLYKGFSSAENVALNAAGICAVGVAMFPTAYGNVPTLINHMHVVFAVLFFICLAYVSIRHASDTLSLVRDTDRARLLKHWYRILGVAMVSSPVLAIMAAQLLRPRNGEPSTVFFLEAFGAWAFAAFWLLKTWELQQTGAERAAAQGFLKPAPEGRPASIPGRLIQVAPIDESLEELEHRMAAERGIRHADR